MSFDDNEWNAFYRLFEAARDLGHESEVDSLCVLFEDDASAAEIKQAMAQLIKSEAQKHEERAADAA